MISVVQPYYNHKKLFDWQLKNLWKAWTSRMKENLELIIVDDGSPDHPCTPPKETYGVNLKILRVEENIPWNTGGASNLGIQEATHDWFLHADFDVGIAKKTAGVLDLDMSNPNMLYWFWRTYTTGKDIYKADRPHCNTFLMNKARFWEVGGYDEDFSGSWGWGDTEFHRIRGVQAGLENTALKEPSVELIRELEEYGHPASVGITRYDPTFENKPHNRGKHVNHHKYKEREEKAERGEIVKPTSHIRFNWHQVYP